MRYDGSMALRIASATERNLSLILSFIKKLAEYEKLSHVVVATEDLLRDALFGPRPAAEVIIAFWNDEPVGFALFFHNFSPSWAGAGFTSKTSSWTRPIAAKESARPC